MTSLSLPPVPSSTTEYSLWRKDVAIWAKITDITKIKQGRALQYVCRGNEKLHEHVLNIDDNLVDCENGLENVLNVIDKILAKSDYQVTIDAFESFVNIKRKPSQTLQDFLLDFELLVNKLKRTGNFFNENLIFYKVLTALTLPETETKIIKATVTEFTYSALKEIINRMYSSSTDLPITAKLQQQNLKSIEKEVVGVKNVCLPQRKRKYQSHDTSDALLRSHIKKYKDYQFSFGNCDTSKRYPPHRCYSPDHWDSICNIKRVDESLSENNMKTFDESSAECDILFSNYTKAERKVEKSSDISSSKFTKTDSSFNLINYGAATSLNKNSNTCKISDKPQVTHFNEAVIIDITQLEDKYIITFLDAYSSFALSTTTERIDESELLIQIKTFWNDVFSTPCTFICGNSKTASNLLQKLEVPILFLDDLWVENQLKMYYTKFNDYLFKIRKDINCSISQAVLWASSIVNSNITGKELIAPAFRAFEFIPLLPCVKGCNPPLFDSKQRYEKVVNDYFEALKVCYRQNKKRKGCDWLFLKSKRSKDSFHTL